jgi:hypothetical protein
MPTETEDLLKGMLDATKPIPGFEDTDLRYAGNENMGYFPCMKNGSIVLLNRTAPLIFPTMAHLRMWAHGQSHESNIVIPKMGVPEGAIS